MTIKTTGEYGQGIFVAGTATYFGGSSGIWEWTSGHEHIPSIIPEKNTHGRCAYCGVKAGEEEKFCSGCGAPL